MEETHLISLVILLTIIQVALIFTEIIPTISSDSLWNTGFSTVRLAIIFYIGWNAAKSGLKAAAMKGAIAMFSAVAIISIAVLIGRVLQKPILGIAASSFGMILLILLISAVINTVIGAVFSVIGAWLARKFKLKK